MIWFHQHVTHSRFTLIGVKLIDGVGGRVNMWSIKKELQNERLLFECHAVHTHTHTSGLNLMPPL